MPISRMQQPRQMYGLGSFVKKAVKGVTGAVKSIAKSTVGKAALAAAAIRFGGPLAAKAFPGTFGPAATSPFMRALGRGKFLGDTGILSAGKTALFGSNAVGPNVPEGLFQKALSKIPGGGVTAGITAASIAGGMLTPEAQEDVQALRQSGDQGLLKAYLERYYKNLNPIGGKDPEDYEAEVQSFVRANAAYGGRMGYALGTPEQNAMKAASVEGLPLNQNPAGITELDLRDNGGFIPPVGVKEKADDIPAMLSNNEFVFTADAVRNMGDGNVNKGAQRMYDFMKYLENGGRV
jgi:hypothetical protein